LTLALQGKEGVIIMIQLKRAYEKPHPEDGFRVSMERFWPRDLDEKHAKIDLWLKEVAPSTELHQAFGESPDSGRWDELQRLYGNELKDKHRAIKLLREKSPEGLLTLVHAAHNPDHSAALVLNGFLEEPSARLR
jgi:uncharacterized protein YeaO (DUF488 family)